MTTAGGTVRVEALLFDLDGTLVQTEQLKARSYAAAVQELLGIDEADPRVVEAYRELVGGSREEVARAIVARLDLTAALRERMAEHDADEPWQVLVAVRMPLYEALLSDPETLRRHQWPHSIELLRTARTYACRVGLATMSHRPQTERILRALDLGRALDLVLTREDVDAPKPAPDIYRLAAQRLAVRPAACLVIEDSPNGVRAALAAGMRVVALATPFTRAGLRESELAGECAVVRDPDELIDTVRQIVARQ